MPIDAEWTRRAPRNTRGGEWPSVGFELRSKMGVVLPGLQGQDHSDLYLKAQRERDNGAGVEPCVLNRWQGAPTTDRTFPRRRGTR